MVAHITIIPPFRVPDEAIAPLLDRLTETISGCEPFTIELRGAAHFDEGFTTAYLPVIAGSQECVSLRESVSADVSEWTDLEARRHPMVPHVTLASRADAPTVELAVAEFDLFEARFEADRTVVYELGAEGWTALRVAGFLGTRA